MAFCGAPAAMICARGRAPYKLCKIIFCPAAARAASFGTGLEETGGKTSLFAVVSPARVTSLLALLLFPSRRFLSSFSSFFAPPPRDAYAPESLLCLRVFPRVAARPGVSASANLQSARRFHHAARAFSESAKLPSEKPAPSIFYLLPFGTINWGSFLSPLR